MIVWVYKRCQKSQNLHAKEMKYPKSNIDFGKNDTIYHPLQEGKRRVHQFFSIRALHIVTATKSLQADT